MGHFFRRLYRALVDDSVADSAAQLAYYFLFAVFPLLFFVVTLTAFLPLEGAVEDILDRARELMPASALRIVEDHLRSLLERPQPRLLTLGLLTALWTASRGVDGLRKALNLAYDVRETRPFWRTQGMALGVTAAGAILMLVVFAMIVLGGQVGFLLAEKLQVGAEFHLVWSYLRWPITAGVVMLVAALGYYLLPDVEQEFRYITPGSVAGTLVWLGSTYAFTQYVEHFGKFNVTYGSIGGVAVLMLWLYLSGLVFIIGGEINAVLEHGSEKGKARGARVAGERPAPTEERPSAAPQAIAKRKDAGRRLKLRLLLRRRRRTPPPPSHPAH